jgi:hypothetical protein
MSVLDAIHRNIESDYYMTTTLLVAVCGAVSTTRWFFCRICHGSIENLYRWSAIWPLIMWMVSLWTIGQIGYPHQSARYFSPVIALAFGYGFSVSNIRFPSWYYRIWGMFFVLRFAYVTHAWVEGLSTYVTA